MSITIKELVSYTAAIATESHKRFKGHAIYLEEHITLLLKGFDRNYPIENLNILDKDGYEFYKTLLALIRERE